LDWTTYTLAVAALLLTPGPTNTLLALEGAARGLRPALCCVGAEALAYGLAVGVIAFAAAPALEAVPDARRWMTLVAGLFVLALAFRLWRRSTLATGGIAPGPRAVFAATLLNPKGLVFGLALIPATGAAMMPARYALFLAMVVLAGAAWATFGALAGKGRNPALISRAGALVLACAGLSVLASA
jgi:threonine/homoserine/homoserine lactone efflux protein